MTDAASSCQQRFAVRSYELDPYSHVNNGAYISWLEWGREQMLRERGRDYGYYPREFGAYYVVVKIDCDFMASAVANDLIRMRTRIVRIGRSSVVLRQCIWRDGEGGRPLARARVVMAFGDGQKSMPIPQDYRDRYQADDLGDHWTDEEGGERA